MGGFKLKWHGAKATDVAKKAAIGAIQTCAADLQRKSAEEAPIDTGDLRANCSVSQLHEEGNLVYHTVGYDLPYAIVNHERLDFNHPKGGKAKYLEDPYNENVAKYERYIRNAVKQTLNKG